ncbi:hypothetical protein WJX84_005692 [Apatococcus fuscideae]|uniref:Peptidase S49 domain-containing protein n=1 Tax=Apatococcus fuscideae TaxID=2026836 RepID=A0AAW1TA99_9CHLO
MHPPSNALRLSTEGSSTEVCTGTRSSIPWPGRTLLQRPGTNAAGIGPPKQETDKLEHLPRVGVKRYIMHQDRQKAKVAKKAGAGPQRAHVQGAGDARNNDNVKAVVLRIDSPVIPPKASDAICREVKRLRESGKPVIVSMGNIAASGGYYIAAPATKILAEPGTITGSIGVVFGKLNVGGLLRDYGIQPEVIAEGQNANSVSPFSSFSKEQVRHLDGIVDWVYDGFLDIVSTHRKLPREEVLKVAQGRIWTGADALGKGLVDQLGGLDEAIHLAKAEAGFSAEELDRVRVVDYPRPQSLARTLMDNWKTMQATSGSAAFLSLDIASAGLSSSSPVA